MRSLLFILAFVGLVSAWILSGINLFLDDEVVTTDEVTSLLNTEPSQTKKMEARPFIHGDYLLTPLYIFEINARILSKETYWFDRGADLSPIDLALGWGRMSDPKVLEGINIRQSGRWYRWSTSTFPIPRREIETHSANMHMIPADRLIEDQLKSLDEGQNIRLKGQLVRVDAEDGWHWISSVTRNDTGAKSCELVYVTDVQPL